MVVTPKGDDGNWRNDFLKMVVTPAIELLKK